MAAGYVVENTTSVKKKTVGGCKYHLWRHSSVTWPDPINFKVAQRMPHMLCKISARSAQRFGGHFRKLTVGCISPSSLHGRGLTHPGQDKEKMFLLRMIDIFGNTYEIRNIKKREILSCFSRQSASKHMRLDPEKSIWKYGLRSGQMTWPDEQLR